MALPLTTVAAPSEGEDGEEGEDEGPEGLGEKCCDFAAMPLVHPDELTTSCPGPLN